MRPILNLLAALALASPLFAADAPLTADAFDAATVGKTFFYQRGGISYGAEQYLPDHKVVWAFTQTADGLSAQFDGDTADQPIVALRSSPEPMACMGPDVGA